MTETPRPTNSLVQPLLTDLYQITMAYGYWKCGRCNEKAVFELFFRKNPFGGQYTIFCGLDEVLKYLAHFKFSATDIEYLKSTDSLSQCEDGFFDDYLANLDCSEVSVRSMKQGSIAFPRVPLLVISGPLGVTQLLETALLNLVNFPSLLATNASRMVEAARVTTVNGKAPSCLEFGLRRAQGPDGGFTASKYAIVGGFDATAHVLAGKLLGVPIRGTHAHSFVMSFSSLDEVKGMTVNKKGTSDAVELLPLVIKYRKSFGNHWQKTHDGELAAFISYGIAFPDGFLCLIDTYDTVSIGLKNFILVALALNDIGYVPRGVRLDSGDLAALSLKCSKVFKDLAKQTKRDFFKNLDIVASNNINESTLDAMNKNGHAISVFGIGTHLVTCQAQPALGCVYKLVQLNNISRIKLSNDLVKVLIPSCKNVYRLYGKDGWPIGDLMVDSEEPEPTIDSRIMCRNPYKKKDYISVKPCRVEKLHTVVWDKNKGVTIDIPSVDESKKYVLEQKKAMLPGVIALKNPKEHKVYVSDKLFEELHRMWNSCQQV